MAPWLLGLIYFFIIPFASSFIYSINFVTIGETGLDYEFLGLKNYAYMLQEDASFVRDVVGEVKNVLTQVPIILIYSIFVALLLNQKFPGRLFARSLFFIPVIIASGLVIQIIQKDLFANTNMRADESSIFQIGLISEILGNLNFASDLINIITTAVAQIFDLSWKSGVQILLFLSALQRIPPTYYEVASVEGANAWDAFWKITFPVLSPSCLLVGVYTIVDSFTSQTNPVMKNIITRFNEVKYGYASASAIIYFIVIGAFLGAVMLLARKRVHYT
ncbi:MAG: sugar ABC transporter permease [Oscillospiraceae bacterium]|nr:sugar ABC transporter permease [Oscillospiraceae bacterium]MDD4545705.1 sugar ABC transporter permease [Oscillospiraceae bacterium]